MSELKPCPCGKVPDGITVREGGVKWATCYANCCGEWMIEFRATYAEGEQLQQLAVKAWNDATRGKNWQSFLAQKHPDVNGISFECAPGSLRNEFQEWRKG